MKRVGILYHPLKETAQSLANDLQEFLGSKGVSSWVHSAWEGAKAKAQVAGTNLVLSIGGDGTILRAAQVIMPSLVPIVGVNLGKLGFMTELTAAEVQEKLSALLEGKGQIDERATLEAELLPATEKQSPRVFCALNDVVVSRGAVARIIYVDAMVDDQPLTTYKADGVIVATATGSTGYALAAGGPVLHPQAEEFLLLPMLAHLCPNYTMVLPPTSVVTLRVRAGDPAVLSIDGHISVPVQDGATVRVKHSTNRVRFLRIHAETSFYGSLERKLKGGGVA